jgi:hypothetical protein
MASERAFTAAPITSAGGKVITSPFQFYSSGEDNIRVTSLNSVAGVRLKIQGRFINNQQVISSLAHDHVPNSDRTPNTTEFALGVGAVLNLTVFANVGTPTIGQTFAIVQLVRGSGAAATVLGTLLQAYVTSTQHLAFPGSPVQSSLDGPGAVRMFSGTQPPAGVNFTEIVPIGARWQLLAIRSRLTTSGVGGVRVPILTIVNNATDQLYLPQYRGSPAAASDFYVWAAGTPAFTPVAVGYNVSPLPTDLPLSGTIAVTCTTQNLDPADQWFAPLFTVREWLEVL